MTTRFKTWLESVEHLDADILEGLINEQPHTAFVGELPPELVFLDGRFVDLGFENLGLPEPQRKVIFSAFAGYGVTVPGTNWRLRDVAPGRAVAEPVDGNEQAVLPAHWKQGVMVFGPDMNPTWVGHRTRPDQRAGFNLQGYRDAGDGLTP